MSKDSKSRVNAVQTHALCTFFEENPEVIRGYKKTPECIDAVQNKWKNITQQLNSLGPARDHRAWAKYLCDMKAKLKRKQIKWRQNSSGTGPVMSNADDFNEIKLRMLQVLRKHPPESQDFHDSCYKDSCQILFDTAMKDTNDQEDMNHDYKDFQESANRTSNDLIKLTSDNINKGPIFVTENEYKDDEFDAFGKNIVQQLRSMPLAVALETKEILSSVLKKQRLKILRGGYSDPLDRE